MRSPAVTVREVTFSAVSWGSRLKAWNTKPSRSRRTAVSWRSFILARSSPAMNTLPAVGVSRPARQCSSVDLPEPDGPMIATNWPELTAKETWSRAVTWAPPVP